VPAQDREVLLGKRFHQSENARRSKIAPPDSIDSKQVGDKNFSGQLILTLAPLASAAWSARRGVLNPQYTSRLAGRAALSQV
jgi:hypothetical protein